MTNEIPMESDPQFGKAKLDVNNPFKNSKLRNSFVYISSVFFFFGVTSLTFATLLCAILKQEVILYTSFLF